MLSKKQMTMALAVPQMSADGASLRSVSVRDFARMTGIVSYLQVCLALSMESRAILDALIFLCDGDEGCQIELSNLQLAFYVRCEQRLLKDRTLKGKRDSNGKFLTVGGRKVTEGGLEKWIGRRRKVFQAEQERAGIWLIEYERGGHRKGENESGKYRCVCYSLIESVQEILATSGVLDSRTGAREKAINQAVLTAIESERKAVIRPEPQSNFRSARVTADSRVNMGLAHIRAAMDMCFDNTGEFERISGRVEDGFSQLFKERAQMKGILPVVSAGNEAAEKMFGHGKRAA